MRKIYSGMGVKASGVGTLVGLMPLPRTIFKVEQPFAWSGGTYFFRGACVVTYKRKENKK